MQPYRVLFVCIGNACRSQMAEAFARAYGSDVIEAMSAGLYPADAVPPVTIQCMFEKNISMDGCVPKSLDETGADFDLVVNMSGLPLPSGISAPVDIWNVEDPIRSTPRRHREIRDQIENLVQRLILELRNESSDQDLDP